MGLKPYYEHKGIVIYHGNCLEILPQLKKVDLVLTDPPYGIDLQPQRGLTKAIAGDKRDDTKILMQEFLDLLRVKNDTVHYMFGGWSEFWFPELLKDHFEVKNCIVWVKNKFGIGYYMRPQHEFIWYLHKGKPKKPSKAISNVINYPKVESPKHSCEKPIGLLKKLILYADKKPTSILDPFMGSGATLVAAKDLRRKAIGIEIEEEYCEIAAKRLESRGDRKGVKFQSEKQEGFGWA